jgi:hypothetical protein
MASNDLLFDWEAWDGIPPTANAATRDTRNVIHQVMDFDAGTDETAYYKGRMPPYYSGNGIEIVIEFSASSDTNSAHLARWQAAVKRIQIGTTDVDSYSFAAAQSAGATCPGTSGVLQTVTIAFTNGSQMDSLAVGEEFLIAINRDADGTSGTDDMTGDAEIHSVAMYEA